MAESANIFLFGCSKFWKRSRRADLLSRSSLCAALLLLSAACTRWHEAKLRVSGPTPYVRCVAGEPPGAREGRIGAVQFRLQARELTLHKSGGELRLAVFAGTGFQALSNDALHPLTASDADVIVMLGGLGDSETLVRSTVSALGGLHRLVLIVLGGRDSYALSRDALASVADPAVILDASALRSVRVEGVALLPWAGAELGRYALDESRCGFGAEDLNAAAVDQKPTAGQQRWLLSWQDPEAAGGLLGHFAHRVGVQGAIWAWPEGVGDSSDQIQVPRLSAPRAEGPDGAPVPTGFALLSIGAEGLKAIR